MKTKTNTNSRIMIMETGKTIMLTGGGTLGPVTPVLAIAEAWREMDPTVEFVWVGTPNGPERKFVEEAGIPFVSLRAPKLYRYLTWKLALIPFVTIASLVHAFILVTKYKPAWIISAGAYVSVPVAWCGHITGAKVAIHQLDMPVGLSNRLMAPVADVITATWEKANKQFGKKKVHVVGSPIYRKHLKHVSKDEAVRIFDLDPTKPTLLALGGGGGARALNEALARIAPELVAQLNVIHVTGKGKSLSRALPAGYVMRELLVEDFPAAFSLADIVVSRGGIGQMAELVSERKASILVPMPNSPQVANAAAAKDMNAVFVLHEGTLTDDLLLGTIKKVMEQHTRNRLEDKIGSLFPTDGVAEEIVEILKSRV